ncbi:uncharacterized protein NECHADRAFT_81800 [Fusarium vanettenii 77-13-4]|uniref:Uncharacterized protein n=1 Tax=Fusarium vanettenii (strain ATCC MYA-4622 / CBS 123669 / FGSC 9596 / NRRL 45880 / 77-13-4) TaxID=660122 RepID=C7Z9L8_FUSV7|nr:uncharacterized protein NECHADRAFT_81800 [Fusarium vanettenii 77-13-4]EEU39122.1 predicted protein [Fusarium vanettenii 77-13-4]
MWSRVDVRLQGQLWLTVLNRSVLGFFESFDLGGGLVVGSGELDIQVEMSMRKNGERLFLNREAEGITKTKYLISGLRLAESSYAGLGETMCHSKGCPVMASLIPLGVWVVVVSLWFWTVGRGLATAGGRETIRVGLTTGPSQLNTGTVWLAWTSPWSVEEHQTVRLAERAIDIAQDNGHGDVETVRETKRTDAARLWPVVNSQGELSMFRKAEFAVAVSAWLPSIHTNPSIHPAQTGHVPETAPRQEHTSLNPVRCERAPISSAKHRHSATEDRAGRRRGRRPFDQSVPFESFSTPRASIVRELLWEQSKPTPSDEPTSFIRPVVWLFLLDEQLKQRHAEKGCVLQSTSVPTVADATGGVRPPEPCQGAESGAVSSKENPCDFPTSGAATEVLCPELDRSAEANKLCPEVPSPTLGRWRRRLAPLGNSRFWSLKGISRTWPVVTMEQHRTVLAAKLRLPSRLHCESPHTTHGPNIRGDIIYSRFDLASNRLRVRVDDAEQTGWGLGIASFSSIPSYILLRHYPSPLHMLACRCSAVCVGMDVRWLSGNNANGCLISLFKAGQRESNGTFKQPRTTARA